jgi:uncharacterized protein YkwD
MKLRTLAVSRVAAAHRLRPSATPRHRGASLLLTTLLACTIAGSAVASSASVAPSSAPVSVSSSVVPATATTTPALTNSQLTAAAMSTSLLNWINRDRVASGLRAYRSWPAMAALANQRAANMAAKLTLSHDAAGGDPGLALKAAGLQWYSYGEIIGETSYAYGSAAAANLYSMWKASPAHHAIMFSATYNYIGVGVARGANGTTWSSILFTESADHTRPSARNGTLSGSGTTVRFSWSGADPLLQTHTAGLRSFDVLYRVDSGSWRLLRNDTTSRSLVLSNRARHHSYSFRVQSADRRGNLSAWTPVKRIWLP